MLVTPAQAAGLKKAAPETAEKTEKTCSRCTDYAAMPHLNKCPCSHKDSGQLAAPQGELSISIGQIQERLKHVIHTSLQRKTLN
ncbi:MAG: hypothetical protein R3E08_03285 [Thiotrichaceae bacterium]